MKEMTVNDALKLVKSKSAPAISIYLGTNHKDKDGAVRIKSNLQRLYRTAEALIMKSYDPRTRERLLQPLKKALAALRLTRSKGGVAIYHTENFTGIVRLPTAVSDLAVAAQSFHLKPVLRCVQIRRNYYIMAFRKQHAELVLMTADGPKVVDKVGLNIRLDRPTAELEAPKRWLKDDVKVRRQKHLQDSMAKVSRQFESYWQNERLPLLLAGPHHLQESFRACCTYGGLLEKGVVGYIDDLDLNSIAEMSTGMMETFFSEDDRQAIVGFRRADASGLASTDLTRIAAAAAMGQIQSLLVAEDRHLWGRFDRDSGRVQLLDQRSDASSDDLLDDIAELTILKGGRVTVLPSVQMPGGHTIAAVLRWSDPQVALSAERVTVPVARVHARERRVELTA